jgi:hypothetical protein
MAGGGKAKPMAPLMPAELLRQLGLDRGVLLLGLLACRPVLERDEEEGAVGIRHLAQHAVADDRGGVLDARHLHDQLFGLAGDLGRALQRRGVGELDAGKDVTLVLVGQEAGGDQLAEETRPWR